VNFAYLPLPVRHPTPAMGSARVRYRRIVRVHLLGADRSFPKKAAGISAAAR